MSGLALNGPWIDDAAARDFPYRYNGKELNSDFGLGWYDYGARWYDAAVGRWSAVDPMLGATMSLSPYHYTANNPVSNVDPNGMLSVAYDAAGSTTMAQHSARMQEKRDEMDRKRDEYRNKGKAAKAAIEESKKDNSGSEITTTIVQTFSYDKTESGEKTQVGTDKLTKTVISRSQGLTGEIRTTITTTITVDYRGVISTEAEQSAWTETGTGDNYNRSNIVTRKIPYEKLESDIKSAADWVGQYNINNGQSYLQSNAKKASVTVDVLVGLGVGLFAAPALAEGKFSQWAIGTASGMAVSESVSPEFIYATHKNTTEKIE